MYVCVAKMRLQVAVEIHALEKQDIVFSPNLEEALLLPKEIETFLIPYFNKNQTLHLGPVIGILTEVNDHKEDISFPSIQHLCKELAEELAQIGGFFYLFGLQNFQEDKIHGYFLIIILGLSTISLTRMLFIIDSILERQMRVPPL